MQEIYFEAWVKRHMLCKTETVFDESSELLIFPRWLCFLIFFSILLTVWNQTFQGKWTWSKAHKFMFTLSLKQCLILMLSSPSAITEMKSSCQVLSGFLGCPSLSFSTIRPFIWGVLFRQYHGSEVESWNCLVALHRSARVGWSPGKCQISLVFSNIFTDFTTAWHEQWEEVEPHIFTIHREPECRMAQLALSPWAVVLTGTLGWHTPLLSTGLQLHHGLCFTLLLPEEFGRENREHPLESSFSARADPAYSLPPNLYLFLMCVTLSCVQSFHSQPSVTSLWGHKHRAGVPLHGVSVL